VDEHGAFHEQLDFHGRPDVFCARRMRVQARQVYVFSEAAVRGWWAPAKAVAERGFDAMMRHCWAPDGQRGFVHTLTCDLKPLNAQRDAYDHAFGLLAASWAHKALGDPRAKVLAQDILDLMDGVLADRAHGGYLESQPPALPRRSDPHMHLLEACLDWSEAVAEPRYLRTAEAMVDLFRTRFFDPATGTLGEYFEADLTPQAGVGGQVVAPGHHFEWTWLLAWAAARGVKPASDAADRLYAFGARHGLDAAGLAIDECDRAGRQVRKSRRAWPQTELIKGHLTMARRGVPGAADKAAEVALTFLSTYLATDTPGLWMDQFDADGRGVTEWVPASTLYHVVVAFRELILYAEASA
jgi:mannose-6-phosphate isomerase